MSGRHLWEALKRDAFEAREIAILEQFGLERGWMQLEDHSFDPHPESVIENWPY